MIQAPPRCEPCLEGSAYAADRMLVILRLLADEINMAHALGIDPGYDPDAALPEVSTCFSVQTSHGRLIWRDPRSRDGALPDLARQPSIRIIRNDSIVFSIRLPHALPRTSAEAEDLPALADLMRHIVTLAERGSWSIGILNPHAPIAAKAFVHGGGRRFLRWPSHWMPASISSRDEIIQAVAEHRPLRNLAASMKGWEDFASSLTPCLKMAFSHDLSKDILTLSINQHEMPVDVDAGSMEVIRALAIHTRKHES